jgi:signal transduction histidine kinase
MAASVRPERPGGPALRPLVRTTGDSAGAQVRLAALLAHDLKTPLAAIAMNIEFVLSELSKDAAFAPLRAALDDCRAANSRAIEILSDMADASRIDAGEQTVKLSKVEVARMFSGLLRRFSGDAHSRGVFMTTRIDADFVRADEGLLTRSLARLLERAVRHARPGTTIGLESCETSVTLRVAHSTDTPGAIEIGDIFRGLAMQFVDSVTRAQGGGVITDVDEYGAIFVRLDLVRASAAP